MPCNKTGFSKNVTNFMFYRKMTECFVILSIVNKEKLDSLTFGFCWNEVVMFRNLIELEKKSTQFLEQ